MSPDLQLSPSFAISPAIGMVGGGRFQAELAMTSTTADARPVVMLAPQLRQEVNSFREINPSLREVGPSLRELGPSFNQLLPDLSLHMTSGGASGVSLDLLVLTTSFNRRY